MKPNRDCFCSALHYFCIIFLLFVTWCYLPMAVTRQLSFDPISAQQVEHFRFAFFSQPVSHLFFVFMHVCIVFIWSMVVTSSSSFLLMLLLYGACYCASQCNNVYGFLFLDLKCACAKNTWNDLEVHRVKKASSGNCARQSNGNEMERVLKMSKRWLILETNWIGNRLKKEYIYLAQQDGIYSAHFTG